MLFIIIVIIVSFQSVSYINLISSNSYLSMLNCLFFQNGESNGLERNCSSQSSGVLAELLSATKRENKALKQDIMNLKCKLHDAQADLKVKTKGNYTDCFC